MKRLRNKIDDRKQWRKRKRLNNTRNIRRHGYGSQTSSSGGGERKEGQFTIKRVRRREDWRRLRRRRCRMAIRRIASSAVSRSANPDAGRCCRPADTAPARAVFGRSDSTRTTVDSEGVVDCRACGRRTGKPCRCGRLNRCGGGLLYCSWAGAAEAF